ncbi:MAG: MmcQ/YjbR family DNA-binding protein [Acidimicrobiales bacterium]|nr:MmcQ/YjbR family DNA-binding protein [Acidimicrobiales bacterium]
MPFPADEVAAALAEVRGACHALPEVEERPSHGAPTFFVRGKKSFVMFHDDHHGDGRLALWVAAAPGVQAEMVDEEPDRFFVPPYVGHRGWLGVRLDRSPDWAEVAGICADAYRQVAPKTLVARLDADG